VIGCAAGLVAARLGGRIVVAVVLLRPVSGGIVVVVLVAPLRAAASLRS
jgi:uncharacterized membrane protein